MDTKISEETKPEMSNAVSVQKSSCITELLLGYAEIQEGSSWVALLPTWLRNVPKKKQPINLSGEELWCTCVFCRGAEEGKR